MFRLMFIVPISVASFTTFIPQKRIQIKASSTSSLYSDNHRNHNQDDMKNDFTVGRNDEHLNIITEDKGSEYHQMSRRSIIHSALSTTAAITGILMNNPSPAKADEDLLELDQKKVVMQMSSKNIPEKYKVASSSSSSSPDPSSNAEAYYNDISWMTEAENRRIDIFEKAAPSVVYIDTYVESRDAFSTNVMEVPIGTGSGFVWDDKGHIVTNYHVVRNAQSAQVAVLSKVFDDDDAEGAKKKLPSSKQQRMVSSQPPSNRSSMRPGDPGVINFSRRVYKAKVVGVDPGKDIAVLKIDAPVYDLYPIDVGTSTGLKVGQSAYAIGNPFGLDHTLTSGVVSGIGREVRSPIGRPIANVIQSDAAINPGNSGGPLLNSAGKLIGMNTSIYSPSGASAGIGFAIPVDVSQ